MLDKLRQKKSICLVVLVAELLILSCAYCFGIRHIEKDRIKDLELKFDQASGFYDDTISVAIKTSIRVPKTARIYYTLDGNTPTEDSLCYEGPITLAKADSEKVYPVRAAVLVEGVMSPVYESVYVIGDNIADRYKMYVANLSCDETDLYDYYTGIMVPGYSYDKAIEEGLGPDDNIGNFYETGEEWIKDGHFSLFSPEGDSLLSQDVGVSIAGAKSREFEVKSFKLGAKDTETFKLDIFERDNEYSARSYINEFNTLKLRSGNFDIARGNVRTQLCERLAVQSGFYACSFSEKCVLYLNGEFYGIFDIQPSLGRNFVRKRFDLPKDSGVDIYGISEKYVMEDFGVSDLIYADLNDEKNREELEKYVDMDELLKMYAVALLINHFDWPDNNFEAWKLSGTTKSDSIYSDGRIRFLLYDFDTTFLNETPHDSILYKYALNTEMSCFSQIIKSDYYRNRFLVLVSDLKKNVFNEQNVNSLVDVFSEPVIEEMRKHYDDRAVAEAVDSIDKLKQINANAKELLYPQLEELLGVDKKYNLFLSVSEGAIVYWDNVEVTGSDYSNSYYYGSTPTLKIELLPGYSLDSVVVNGNEVDAGDLDWAGLIDGYNDINIEVNAVHDQKQILVVDSFCADGENDRVTIYNAGVDDVELSSFYMSDDPKLPMKYRLPNDILPAGDTITLYGERALYRDKRYIFGYSLNDNERIILYSADRDEVVDDIPIPRMTDFEEYGRFWSEASFAHNVYKRVE